MLLGSSFSDPRYRLVPNPRGSLPALGNTLTWSSARCLGLALESANTCSVCSLESKGMAFPNELELEDPALSSHMSTSTLSFCCLSVEHEWRKVLVHFPGQYMASPDSSNARHRQRSHFRSCLHLSAQQQLRHGRGWGWQSWVELGGGATKLYSCSIFWKTGDSCS